MWMKKMRKSIFIIFVLSFGAVLIWQMSTIWRTDKHSLDDLEGGLLTNTSKQLKQKHGNTKPKHGEAMHRKHAGHHGLTVGDQFYLEGKPFRIIGGSFHYFRTQPHQWIDRLERMKAAGLNTVTTYIPWNLHEPVRGKYSFSGRWKLLTFIKLVGKMGLYMIVRPGPYICAEWEFGGLPAWLLHDPNMTVRTSTYRPYLEHVESYFHQLLPHLAKYTYQNGGPIIAVQIENEFGLSGHDEAYLKFLTNLYLSHGIKEVFLTADNPGHLETGSLPGVLATVNFKKDPAMALQRLKNFQPNKPLMVMEFWPGWFDSWGKKHQTMSVAEFQKTVDMILSMNASINFYMFVGGTNFGFWNGASLEGTPVPMYQPTTTSYDYDALVSESGDCHPTKYKALRLLLQKHNLVPYSLPPIPSRPKRGSYESIMIGETMRMDEFVKLLHHKPVKLSRPVFMEFLNISNHGGQAFGWILYRSTFNSGDRLEIQGFILNRAHVLVNGNLVKVIYNLFMRNITENIHVETKYLKETGNVLEILVENMGRVSGWKLNEQRRGFQGTVTVGGKILSPWEHLSLDFSGDFLNAVSNSNHWKPYTHAEPRYPSLYRGFLNINNLHSTFLYMKHWTKGIVIVNGYNLGRFWSVGPHQTLYVPKPLLKKARNEIIIFELGKPGRKLEFVSEPVLNDTSPLP